MTQNGTTVTGDWTFLNCRVNITGTVASAGSGDPVLNLYFNPIGSACAAELPASVATSFEFTGIGPAPFVGGLNGADNGAIIGACNSGSVVGCSTIGFSAARAPLKGSAIRTSRR